MKISTITNPLPWALHYHVVKPAVTSGWLQLFGDTVATGPQEVTEQPLPPDAAPIVALGPTVELDDYAGEALLVRVELRAAVNISTQSQTVDPATMSQVRGQTGALWCHPTVNGRPQGPNICLLGESRNQVFQAPQASHVGIEHRVESAVGWTWVFPANTFAAGSLKIGADYLYSVSCGLQVDSNSDASLFIYQGQLIVQTMP